MQWSTVFLLAAAMAAPAGVGRMEGMAVLALVDLSTWMAEVVAMGE